MALTIIRNIRRESNNQTLLLLLSLQFKAGSKNKRHVGFAERLAKIGSRHICGRQMNDLTLRYRSIFKLIQMHVECSVNIWLT